MASVEKENAASSWDHVVYVVSNERPIHSSFLGDEFKFVAIRA
jgi:hypothetical protein